MKLKITNIEIDTDRDEFTVTLGDKFLQLSGYASCPGDPENFDVEFDRGIKFGVEDTEAEKKILHAVRIEYSQVYMEGWKRKLEQLFKDNK